MDVSLSRYPVARSVALGASVLLNIVLAGALLWPDGAPSEPPSELAVFVDEAAPSVIELEAMDVPDGSEGVAVAEAAVAEAAVAEAAVAEAAVAETVKKAEAPRDDVEVTIASVRGSIPQTLAEPAAPLGDNVSATLSRVLVWDLDLRRDLRAGDTVEVMWRPGTSDGVVIEAARYFAQKFNRTITAYRFQATGDKYASYWSAEGVEIPHRLRNSPLKEYEQITSLLKDRPTHQGMDFKVDVGTPIVTPFAGVVTRVNWNVAANGYCVEVRHDDGVLAKHLHLSETLVKEGTRVHAGQVVALSGNTGRSTGPHLHYQLNRGTAVVDPVDYHGTDRRKLPESDRAAFAQVVAAANARIDAAGALATR